MTATEQPDPNSAESAGADVPTEGGTETVVPPVVLVLVTRDPGPWFDETLESIAAQTYDNVSVFVVDAASTVDPSAKIASVLPAAHIRRLSGNPGFATACNEALGTVTGASFFLFCHDDVALAPDAIQAMVEEAFRSNAGVVGPKIVDWRDPDRLLSVGMGADKHGFPVAGVERGELDQSQHDAVRDVFYIPGAATLIRADLFEVMGGFDPGISFHGEDLDLCWRTHVLGARVIVAPQARVRHLEALGERRPIDDRRKLQMRHRLRAAKVSYATGSRVKVLPQSFVLSMIEVLYCLVLGRFRQVGDVTGAWRWNWSRSGDIRTRRRALNSYRIAHDRDVRRLQSRGNRRLSAFLRGQIGSNGDRLLAGRRDVKTAIRSSKALTSFSVWFVLAIVLVVGSRHLIFGRLPAIGDLPMFGHSASELLREWVSGYRSVGLGSEAPNPTGLGFLGFAGLALFDNLELLRKILILGMLPIGALGMWRLVKPVGTRRSRIVGLVVYMSIPVAYQSMERGQWTGLVMFGLSPWILSQFVRASKVAPFGPLGGDRGPGVRDRPLAQRMVAVGVLGALAMMVDPVSIVVVVLMAVALVVGGLLAGQLAGAARLLATAIGGAVVAFVLHLPWSLSFITTDWRTIVRTSSTAGASLDLGRIVRFDVVSGAGSPFGYAFVVAAVVALFIGRRWRAAWAVRSWVLAAGAFAGVWVWGQGWLPGELPVAQLLLAPAAAGLAMSSAMGMAAFEVDLPDYHFGWRQIVALAGGAALVLGVLPLVGASIDGRWGLPRGDYNRPLAFMDKEAGEAPFRVLWLGEAEALPVPGWRLDIPGVDDSDSADTIVYATTDNGTPRISDFWPGARGDATLQLERVLELAADGGTSRLGALLAPMGVRYIVIPLGISPAPYTKDPRRPAQLLNMFEGQLDLSAVDVNVGVVVYRNVAWGPTRALLPSGTEVSTGGATLSDRTIPDLAGAPVALERTDHYADFSGDIERPSVVYLAEASSQRWHLEVGGTEAPRSDAMGWSNVFEVDTTGSARLHFETATRRPLMLAGQVLVWIAAVFFMLRVRVVTDERRSLEVDR